LLDFRYFGDFGFLDFFFKNGSSFYNGACCGKRGF